MNKLTLTINVEVLEGGALRITSSECKCEVFTDRSKLALECAQIAHSWADAEPTVTALDSINQSKN